MVARWRAPRLRRDVERSLAVVLFAPAVGVALAFQLALADRWQR